jgi:hypothetical protein
MKFEFWKPKIGEENKTNENVSDGSKSQEGFKKIAMLAKLLLAFEIAIGGVPEGEKTNDTEALKNKITENADFLNRLITKINQEGRDVRVTNGPAKAINKELNTHNINAIHTESNVTIIHHHNKAADEQTGETRETGITTFVDVNSDGQVDRVIMNNDEHATEANAQLLGMQKDFSDFDMVSMMSQKKKESLAVMNFSENGELTIYNYGTGEEVRLDQEKSADFINSANNGYNINLSELTE